MRSSLKNYFFLFLVIRIIMIPIAKEIVRVVKEILTRPVRLLSIVNAVTDVSYAIAIVSVADTRIR